MIDSTCISGANLFKEKSKHRLYYNISMITTRNCICTCIWLVFSTPVAKGRPSGAHTASMKNKGKKKRHGVPRPQELDGICTWCGWIASKPSEDSAYETTKDHGGSVVNSQAALQNLCYCVLKLRYINSMINSSPGYELG